MPHLSLELHDRWPKGVLVRKLDVHEVPPALVRRVRRAFELPPEMCEVVRVSEGLHDDLRERVVLDIRYLFGDTACAV